MREVSVKDLKGDALDWAAASLTFERVEVTDTVSNGRIALKVHTSIGVVWPWSPTRYWSHVEDLFRQVCGVEQKKDYVYCWAFAPGVLHSAAWAYGCNIQEAVTRVYVLKMLALRHRMYTPRIEVPEELVT